MNLLDSARFFIVYPMNLEDLGLLELDAKFKKHFPEASFSITAKAQGGVEIECPLMCGLLLNRILRSPTRILLRLTEFKCRDFPKLYQKISKFNWSPFLVGQTPEVECASNNSRLFDSRKIEKAIADGVLQYYRHKPVKKKYLEHFEKFAKVQNNHFPKIYFRAIDDTVTLSIDTTGERLHLRGEKTLTGLAPIRENLAALLITEIMTKTKIETPVTLIDPMCGSGTFLIEAKNKFSITEARDFSFLHMPLVMDNLSLMPELKDEPNTQIEKYIGFEMNPEVVNLAKKNVHVLGKEIEIGFYQEDLFSNNTHKEKNPVVIMNPPYGIRVGENINLDFYLKIIRTVEEKFHPQILGIIIPADYKINSTKEWSVVSARAFKNGGIEVVFYTILYLR